MPIPHSIRWLALFLLVVAGTLLAGTLPAPRLRGSLTAGGSAEERVRALSDIDGNGAVSAREARRALLAAVLGVARRDAAYDLTGDGATDRADLRRFVAALRAVLSAICGNGVREAGEQCDDGNAADGDGCSRSCISEPPPPVCGDGLRQDSEACDDANATEGDGCTDCRIDAGAVCDTAATPSACEVRCGNGVLDAGPELQATQQWQPELCDDGNRIDGDLCDSACRPTPGAWWVRALNAPGPVERLFPDFVYEGANSPVWEGPFRLFAPSGGAPKLLWSWYRYGRPESTRESVISTKTPEGWTSESLHYTSLVRVENGIAHMNYETAPLGAPALIVDERGGMTVLFRAVVSADCPGQTCFRLIQRPAGSPVWSRATTVPTPGPSAWPVSGTTGPDSGAIPDLQDAAFDSQNRGLLVWRQCTATFPRTCVLVAMTFAHDRWNTPFVADSAPVPTDGGLPAATIVDEDGTGTFRVRWGGRTVPVIAGQGAALTPECGNGVINPGEICDGDNLGTINGGYANSCIFSGYRDGPLTCRIDCSLDVSACTQDIRTSPPVIEVLAVPLFADGARVVAVVRGFDPQQHRLTAASGTWSRELSAGSEIDRRGIVSAPLDASAPRTGSITLTVLGTDGSTVAERSESYTLPE